MQSSGMLRRAALVRTDTSEERIASIIRVTVIGELGTTITVTSNRSILRRNTVTLMMVAIHSSETSLLRGATRRNIPEDGILCIYLVAT
jgi:demethoxyubiquinone hydroxylase (CLK1/Coq7/Cat5 family)